VGRRLICCVACSCGFKPRKGQFQLYWNIRNIPTEVAHPANFDFEGKPMTLLDVVFKYGTPPGEKEMGALNNAWEIYGVRKIKLDEKEHTIRVEYDASRLSDGEIAAILRRAGIDLREKVQLV
jgi:hypothetical protein